MGQNINLQQIADNLGFELSDIEMLINMFIEASNDSLDQMQTAIQSNNFDDIVAAAHAIKGSAANIMLEDITNLAKDIELSSHDKLDIDYSTKCEQLRQLVNSIL
jgi:HPt (histidine-containing phosphotransfer) domain-containing protein